MKDKDIIKHNAEQEQDFHLTLEYNKQYPHTIFETFKQKDDYEAEDLKMHDMSKAEIIAFINEAVVYVKISRFNAEIQDKSFEMV